MSEHSKENQHTKSPERSYENTFSGKSFTTPDAGIQSMIDNSPRLVAQRQKLESIFASKTVLQKKTKEEQASEAKENKTGLPDNLKTGLENLSGISMDDVKVHSNSSKPKELNALAYAQGNDIHLGPGQEKHLPHEAWHVVQQHQGRVKSTAQMKGIAVNEEDVLEKEADEMGEKAFKGDFTGMFNSNTSANATDNVFQMVPEMTDAQVEIASAYNNGLNLEPVSIKMLQFALGTAASGTFDGATIIAIAEYSRNNRLAQLQNELADSEKRESLTSLNGPLSQEQTAFLVNSGTKEPETIRGEIHEAVANYSASDGQLDRDTFANLFARLISQGRQSYAIPLAIDYLNLDQSNLISISYDENYKTAFKVNVPFSTSEINDQAAVNNQFILVNAPTRLKKVTLGKDAVSSLNSLKSSIERVNSIQYLNTTGTSILSEQPANDVSNGIIGTTENTSPLTTANIQAAQGHNNFILSAGKSKAILQAQLGLAPTNQFDNTFINAIANYQTANNLSRTDGKIDFNTLDHLIRAIIQRGEHEAVLRLAVDFYNLDEHAVDILLKHQSSQTADHTENTNIAGIKDLTLGGNAFSNGLTGLGLVLQSAIGNEVLINEKLMSTALSGTNNSRQTEMWSNPNTNQESGAVPWIRGVFPEEADVSSYIGRTDITADEKIKTLGLLSVELGRLEFLMGVIYHGGNNQSWETAGSNKGPFVNHYKSQVGNNTNSNPWCTMFSGYLKRMLGFNAQLSTQGPLIFNSGSRLDWWGTAGTNLISGQDDFTDPSDFQNYTGANIDTPAWQTLRTTLSQADLTDEQKQTHVNTFLNARITPQAGDILVVNNTTNNTYGSGLSSHTTTVESYSNYTITTVEGNKGNKVTGTSVDLTDANNVGNVLFLIRLGTEFFPAPAAAPNPAEGAEATNTNTPTPVVTAESLLSPLQFMSRNLQLLAGHKNYISSSVKGALIEQMSGANNGGGTQ